MSSFPAFGVLLVLVAFAVSSYVLSLLSGRRDLRRRVADLEGLVVALEGRLRPDGVPPPRPARGGVSWERVSSSRTHTTDRLPVPGGWLVAHGVPAGARAMCFVPDEYEEWLGGSAGS